MNEREAQLRRAWQRLPQRLGRRAARPARRVAGLEVHAARAQLEPGAAARWRDRGVLPGGTSPPSSTPRPQRPPAACAIGGRSAHVFPAACNRILSTALLLQVEVTVMPPQGVPRKRSVGRRFSSFLTLYRRVGAALLGLPALRLSKAHAGVVMTQASLFKPAAARGAGPRRAAWAGPAAPPQPGGREPQVSARQPC